MNKNSLLPICLLLLLWGSYSSCSKDEQVVKTPVTRTQLLSKSWKQTDLLASIPGSAPTSVFLTVMEACQRDNIWLFKADGTYIVSEGATKCNTTDPDQATSGTWQFTNAENSIIIDDINETPQTFIITELTSSSLKITGTQLIQGNNVTGTAIFQPQ